VLHAAPVAGNHRLQHRGAVSSAMDVDRPQCAALDIAELIEHEQRAIAGAAGMSVVGAALPLTVGRVLARTYDPRRSPTLQSLDDRV